MFSPTGIYKGWKRRDFVTLIEWMNRVPPWKCRAMAAKQTPAGKTTRITVNELIKLSGIPRRTLAWISYRRDWSEIDVDVASRFAFACGVNLLAKKPESRFIRKNFKVGLPFFDPRQRRAFDRAAKGMK